MTNSDDSNSPSVALSHAVDMDLIMNDDRWRWLAELEPRARALLDQTYAKATADYNRAESAEAELSIVFTCDREVQLLNRDYRHKDSPTNVLSFASFEGAEALAAAFDLSSGVRGECGPPVMLGDIFIAYETCEREAKAQGKTMINHVAHLMVHGLLHLLGYDHIEDADAEIMEQTERSLLAVAGIDDPYQLKDTGDTGDTSDINSDDDCQFGKGEE